MPEVILPCPACGSKSIEIDWDNGVHFMKCERCGVSGPCFIDEYPREFVADAWNALPRMSAIIAWQFQAAGAALENQRLKAILQGIMDNDGGEKGFNALELDKFRQQARAAIKTRHE